MPFLLCTLKNGTSFESNYESKVRVVNQQHGYQLKNLNFFSTSCLPPMILEVGS